MRRAAWVVIGVIWLGTGPAAFAQDDFQAWQSADIAKRIGARWELAFLPEVRIRHDASQLFRHEYRQSLRWKPSPRLQLGVNYLFARDESSGKPREEHTAEADVTPKASVGQFDLSLRWRLAMRTIQGNSGEQEWQTRLMPKIAWPATVAGRSVTPYVADDLFYEYTRDAWNQNRLFLGVAIPVNKAGAASASVDVYYMLQSQLGSPRHEWSSNHILGTKLGVKF